LANPLTWAERTHIRLARRAHAPGLVDRLIRLLLRMHALWINFLTGRRLRVLGLDRLPPLAGGRSFVVASNHRSYFDMFVVTCYLAAHGMKQRIVYPVRSNFFYDHPLGMIVNGLFAWFSMYPPIFRDAKRLALNLASLEEAARLLRLGDTLLGVHPEGTRNKGDDPYTLLPAHSGVGRIVHRAQVAVLPVFLHGIGNGVWQEVKRCLRRSDPIFMVFGAPVPLDDLLAQPGNARVYTQITERIMGSITALGEEERTARRGIERAG
jgi:1-acyl-sn-glycerol-3-phosphate acyltransferase